MPIHDWTRVEAGTFHDFHQAWTIAIRNALNTGGLPPGFFAMAEQIVGGPLPDVVTLKRQPGSIDPSAPRGGVALADRPPRVQFVTSAEPEIYAARANQIVVKHRLGEVIAVIEIVSPGNKGSRNALRAFVEKARQLLNARIHLLVIDLFPPSERDPQGMHKAIWDEIREEPFQLSAAAPLTLAAYSAGTVKTAYVEPVAVADVLPSMPIFLEEGWYVPAPLEETYQAAWAGTPGPVRELLDPRAA